MKKRKIYSKEFKLEALRQWEQGGQSARAVASSLGLPLHQTLVFLISHPWNMRKTKESLNPTVHQSQYTSIARGCPLFAPVLRLSPLALWRSGALVSPTSPQGGVDGFPPHGRR